MSGRVVSTTEPKASGYENITYIHIHNDLFSHAIASSALAGFHEGRVLQNT